MTRSDTRIKVEQCISSVFSKEDVLKLIDGIDIKLDAEQIHVIVSTITWKLEASSVLDFDSAEFNLRYGFVVLEDIMFDDNKLEQDIENILNELKIS